MKKQNLVWLLTVVLFFISNLSQAAVCSLGGNSCNGISYRHSDNDLDMSVEELCKEAGYAHSSCSGSQIPDISTACPYSTTYFKNCLCPAEYRYSQSECSSSFQNSILGNDTCTKSNGTVYAAACVCDTAVYKYTLSTCVGNEELSGEICRDINNITYGAECVCKGGSGKYVYDKEKCVSSHQSGANRFDNWEPNGGDVCQGKSSGCVCTPDAGACSGYTYDTNNCTGYKIGESCNNGCQLKWKCKDTCPYLGTLNSCPAGYACTYEDCSGKWYVSGCAAGGVDVSQTQCSWYTCYAGVWEK